MSTESAEPISDADVPTEEEVAPHEHPDPDSSSQDASDQDSAADLEEHLDADEGDPSLDSYPG
jgi:hypothetical protein